MRNRYFLFLTLVLFFHAPGVLAQNKLLTIDDIFDPVKKVNFNGTTPTVRWLKDGKHYLLTSATKGDTRRSKKSMPRPARLFRFSMPRKCRRP